MAAASFIKAAETELSCSVCRELFIEPHIPKDLQCGHVICAPCLKGVVRSVVNVGNRIKCPECRTIILIPPGGVDALRTNRKIRSLAEKHPQDKTDHDHSPDYAPPRKNKGKMDKKHTVPVCQHHAGEKKHFFCSRCNDLVCRACLVLKHKDHTVEEVKDRYERQKIEIQTQLSETMVKILHSQEALTELRDLDNQVKEAQRIEEYKIDKCVKRVRETAQQLKNKLQVAGQKKSRRIYNQLSQLKSDIDKAVVEHAIILNILEKCTEHEYIIQHKHQLDKLTNVNIQIPYVCDNGQAAAVFKEDIDGGVGLGEVALEEDQVNHLADGFSSLMVQRPGDKTCMALQPKQTLFVFGLTPLAWTPNNQLVVVESFKKEITIYEIRHGRFEESRSWKTSDAKWNPLGIAVSPKDGHFCVTMWDRTRIYSPQGRFVKEFKGPFKNGMTCVNITTKGALLLGHYESHRSLAVCDEVSGMKKLPASIPQKYMTLIRDRYVAMSDWESGKVTVLDIQTGQETLTINVPWVRGVCYDGRTNSLLVVANKGTDIEQYSYTSGKFLARLVKGLNNACYLALSTSGILAITENGCVKLCKVEYKM